MMPHVAPLPLLGTLAGFRRFTVEEYHRLTEIGILTEDDNLELIDGYLVLKMARNPPHDGTLHRLLKWLTRSLPAGWDLRIQAALTLSESEPEPDLAVVAESPDGYTSRHPTAGDAALVVEVSDSTLAGDRADKGRIYARDGIGCYWIVNLVDRQVEVYTGPTPSGYAHRQDCRETDRLSLHLAGAVVASAAVSTFLP